MPKILEILLAVLAVGVIIKITYAIGDRKKSVSSSEKSSISKKGATKAASKIGEEIERMKESDDPVVKGALLAMFEM